MRPEGGGNEKTTSAFSKIEYQFRGFAIGKNRNVSGGTLCRYARMNNKVRVCNRGKNRLSGIKLQNKPNE